MANSVGSVTFTLVRGPALPAPQAELQEITREGIDGIGVKILGLRGAAVTWQCFSYHSDSAAAETQMAAIRDLQGDLVTAVDDWGVSTGDVLVEEATVVSKQQVILAGTGNRVEVIASIRMRVAT